MRFTTIVVAATLLTVLMHGRAAHAQRTPADTVGVLIEIAERLHADGESEMARALLTMAADRYPGQRSAEVRRLLDLLMAHAENRSGRTQLIAWNTLYGSWLGVALPLAFSSNPSEESLGLGLLVLGPTGFAVSKYYANNNRMTSAQAAAATFGSMWGTFQGIGWRAVFDIGDRRRLLCPGDFCFEDRSTSQTAPYAAAVIGGVAGLVAGPALAGGANLTGGQMTTISHGAYWGSWFGVAAGVIAEQEGDALLTTTLIAGDLGLVTAAAFTKKLNLTTGQVWLTSAAGLAGLVAGLGVDLLAQPEDAAIAMSIPAAGSLIGLGLGLTAAMNSRSTSGPEFGEAALNLIDGRLRPAIPLPTPELRWLPDGEGGTTPSAGMRLGLLSARF